MAPLTSGVGIVLQSIVDLASHNHHQAGGSGPRPNKASQLDHEASTCEDTSEEIQHLIDDDEYFSSPISSQPIDTTSNATVSDYMDPDNQVEDEQALQHLLLNHELNQSSPEVELPANVVRARRDRQILYIMRTRADGSTSFIQPAQFQAAAIRKAFRTNTTRARSEDETGQKQDPSVDGHQATSKPPRILTKLIPQMMFVSGEQVEPSPETTWMIEEIVREQVVEMLKEATILANRRGSKSISIADLIFQIRHNPAKVSRLKTFLSWKDVRKNVKDSDDKAGGADADALDLEDGALPGANPSAPQKASTNKKAKLVLPWEVQSFYNETVPEREDEEDEEEEEQNEATLARLASADERTKNMTREEYVYWSECRQASFTFRKGKRFREWAGFGTIIDSKPNDDVVDILGFLTFEIVQTLTEEALRVKAAEDLANKKASVLRGDNENNKKRKREGCTLFEMPEEDRTPVEPKHVREAFRRLQIVPAKYKFMRQGYAGIRTPLRLI